jgi:hypothetical protein
MSVIATAIVLAVSYAAVRAIPPSGFAHKFGIGVACFPPAVLVGAALFIVRGYEVDRDFLRIERLLWPTVFRLDGITRLWQDPAVLKGSLRLFGNGGLYSFSGVFYSKRLGRYRLFATDWRNAVVLVLPERIVVVTPADASSFVESVRALFPHVVVGPP